MVAGFLALRLYMVLGKRTGHEQPLPKAAEDRAIGSAPAPRVIETTSEAREPSARLVEAGAEPGIRAIIAGDSSFDVGRFLDGSKSAYRMILESFWKGDEATLDWLVEAEVKASFAEAIAERTAAGHVLDNRLVTIENATVAGASLQGKVARISVRIDADIAAVTRDAEGNLVSGSLSDAVETHELWTFTRTLKSSDQNWKLAETDEV